MLEIVADEQRRAALADVWAREDAAPAPRPYTFLPAEGEGLHQIPVGPVHAGIIEPGHFRFSASGETVVRLEERLGYVHKGIEKRFESLTQGGNVDRDHRQPKPRASERHHCIEHETRNQASYRA